MAEAVAMHEPVLEVTIEGKPRQSVPVARSPFLIGRGAEEGNHLRLEDPRISRRCAAIVRHAQGFSLQDRGHRLGLFVNGQRISDHPLHDGDTIQFGLGESCQIVFRAASATSSVEQMLTRIGSIPSADNTLPSGGLSKLNLLLEATSLLHSALPLESVLSTMLDHAIRITRADRGMLLEPDNTEVLRLRLARGASGEDLMLASITPSQTAIRMATDSRIGVVTADLNTAGIDLQSAASVVVQGLRSVVAIPLYGSSRAAETDTGSPARGQLLGVLYLDSRHPAAFSDLDRQILDAIGAQAASILDNARLVERERERQRMEQELSIAREIQQALVPHGLKDFPHLQVAGSHHPCQAVGGDYFDVLPLDQDRIAFLIADVSGKGLGAALMATMLQGALSGMRLGAEPERVFNHVNRFLCEHAVTGRYATMFFGIVDGQGRLEYMRGGHPSPLLLRRGEVTDLYTAGSFPVGLIDEAVYSATRMQLEPGDTLILFSDGITEAEDAHRTLFGFDRLRTLLTGHGNEPLEQLESLILNTVNEYSAAAGQSDDMTLLIVRYRHPM